MDYTALKITALEVAARNGQGLTEAMHIYAWLCDNEAQVQPKAVNGHAKKLGRPKLGKRLGSAAKEARQIARDEKGPPKKRGRPRKEPGEGKRPYTKRNPSYWAKNAA